MRRAQCGDIIRSIREGNHMNMRRTALVFLVLCVFLVAACKRPVDFTGFWKVNCSDAFGVQIKKQPGNLFSVSFCGPGGCFAPGEWMPNTSIPGDQCNDDRNTTRARLEPIYKMYDGYQSGAGLRNHARAQQGAVKQRNCIF